jgi:hypothetical protein
MKPRTPSEELIAQALANALRGNLALGPLDVMRLATAAIVNALHPIVPRRTTRATRRLTPHSEA